MKKIIFLIVLLSTKWVYPQGFKNPPVGSAALSQAGAFVAQSDDATATVYNPAGLIQIDNQQVITGATYIYSETKYSGKNFSAEKKFTPVLLPYLFYGKKLGENTAFGLGVYSPYGQTLKWGLDSAAKWGYLVPYYASMQTTQISFAMAFKFTTSLSGGMGVNFFHSRVIQNSLLPSDQLLKMKAIGQTCAPSLGILYKHPKYSIGLNYQAPFKINYSGKVRIPDTYQDSVKAKIDFPSVINTGVAFYPNKKLKIEGDIEYIRFSNFKKLPIRVGELISYEIEKNWKNVFDFYLGLEYKKSKNIKFRGGIGYIKSPVPEGTWDPALPDADRVAFSIGSEIKNKIGIFDISFVTSIFDKTNLKQGGYYDGIYKTRAYFFTVQFKKFI